MSTTTNAGVAGAVQLLQSRLPGRVWPPGESGYAVSTPWDLAVSVHPAAVVAAAGADDVVDTVRVAAQVGCRVAVQATGHGAVPLDEDAILVHTGRLQECEVDEAARTVRVGAGMTWQQVLDVVAPLGLAPVCGSSTNVGVAGYLTGGGIGPLVRQLGVSSDWVASMEIVTGDGVVRSIGPDREPDLFWAARGGKSTVGVVVSVTLHLLPISTLYGGALYFAGSDLGGILAAWLEWSRGLPTQAGTSLAVLQLPDLPVVPPPLAGTTCVAVRYASLEEPDAAEKALAPIREVAAPIFGGVGPMPYSAIAGIHSDPTAPTPTVHDTALLDELDGEGLQHLVELAGPGSGSRQSVVELRQLGGAYARPRSGDSAFDGRAAAYNLYVSGDLRGTPGELLRTQAAGIVSALAGPASRKLVNFADAGDPDQLQHCYHRATLGRLLDVADRYDPAHILSRPLRAAGRLDQVSV